MCFLDKFNTWKMSLIKQEMLRIVTFMEYGFWLGFLELF